MKRRLIAVGTVTAAALVLAGCAGTSAPASTATSTEDGAPATVSIALWDLQKTPEFTALITAFQKANPNITIQPVDIPSVNYEDKITTMLAGGDSTDIITVKNLTDFGGYMQKQQFQKVDDVIAALPKDKIPATEQYKYKGAYYAAAYRQDFHVLYYNKDLFKAAGVEDPDNLTWDEFAAAAKKLTTGDGASKTYGAYIHTWNSMVQGYAAAQQDKPYDKADYSWMSDQYDVTLEMQKAGSTMDWATANSTKTGYANMFETGKAAMVPMGTWLIAPLLADKKAGTTSVNWGIAPVPQRKAGGKITTMGGPTGFAINKNAKNAAAAKKFLEFAAGPEGAEAVAGAGIVPAYHSDEITKAYFALEGMPQDALSKKAFAPDTIRADGPTGPDAAAIGGVLKQEHELIMTGSKSVDDGLTEMADRVKNEVLQQ
jgi:multiple sugar transport system substrate-binding protein